MLNNFLPYEEKLFFLINGNRSHFLDDLMWLFSSLKIWFPLAIVMIFCVTYKKCWKQWLTELMALIIVFVLCDQFSSHLIKPLFKRATFSLNDFNAHLKAPLPRQRSQ